MGYLTPDRSMWIAYEIPWHAVPKFLSTLFVHGDKSLDLDLKDRSP